MSKTGNRTQRLERSGIPPLYGREFRALVPSKPRGVEAARALVDPSREAVRADDDGGPVIEGTGTVYDVWYQVGHWFPFREKFAPGAFKKTLADGADVRSMFNHDTNRLMGRRSAGSLDVWESDDALNYKVQVNADDPLAMSAHAQVKRGDVNGSSIWFSVVREEWTFADEDNGLEMDEVIVREAKLTELGAVVFPANEAAESSARSLDSLARGLGVTDDDERRSMVLEALADPDRALEAFRRALGVDVLPDLRVVCTAARDRGLDHKCSCGGDAADSSRAADEAPGTPSDTPPMRHLSLRQHRSRALAARFGLTVPKEG